AGATHVELLNRPRQRQRRAADGRIFERVVRAESVDGVGVAAERDDGVDGAARGGADDADVARCDAADADQPFGTNLDVGARDDHLGDGLAHGVLPSRCTSKCSVAMSIVALTEPVLIRPPPAPSCGWTSSKSK